MSPRRTPLLTHYSSCLQLQLSDNHPQPHHCRYPDLTLANLCTISVEFHLQRPFLCIFYRRILCCNQHIQVQRTFKKIGTLWMSWGYDGVRWWPCVWVREISLAQKIQTPSVMLQLLLTQYFVSFQCLEFLICCILFSFCIFVIRIY